MKAANPTSTTMPFKILTLPFDPAEARFDDEPLAAFLANKHLKRLVPRFFEQDGQPADRVPEKGGSFPFSPPAQCVCATTVSSATPFLSLVSTPMHPAPMRFSLARSSTFDLSLALCNTLV